jgi:hypothetical protein
VWVTGAQLKFWLLITFFFFLKGLLGFELTILCLLGQACYHFRHTSILVVKFLTDWWHQDFYRKTDLEPIGPLCFSYRLDAKNTWSFVPWYAQKVGVVQAIGPSHMFMCMSDASGCDGQLRSLPPALCLIWLHMAAHAGQVAQILCWSQRSSDRCATSYSA